MVWGLLYNTADLTVALPAPKVQKAYHLLHQGIFDTGCTSLRLKDVQELRGNQQYWVLVKRCLKPLLGATDALLGGTRSDLLAVPKGTPRQQQRAWREFWEAIEL